MTNRLTAEEIVDMREEVVNVQLDHLCTVQRKTEGAVDADNNPTITWSNLLVNVPCHWWRAEDREIADVINAGASRDRVVFTANTAVRQADRVTSITDTDGDQVASAVPFDIEDVRDALNQVVVTLRGVR